MTVLSPAGLSKFLVLTVLSLSLSACGFSLRGSSTIADALPVLTLNLQQPNAELSRQLRTALINANVELLPLPDTAAQISSPVLSIGADETSLRPVTLTPRARAAQYEVGVSVEVSLVQGDTVLFGPEILSAQQVYYEDTDTLSGNREEAEVITSELRSALVNQILRRLEAIGPGLANR